MIGSAADMSGSVKAYPITVSGNTGTVIVPSWALPTNNYFSFAYTSTPLPLPVIYTKELSAQKVNSEVQLSWITGTEINNQGFNVQRSAISNSSWTTIDYISSYFKNGNGDGHAYISTDHSPLMGNNYYRLEQIDQDGKTTISNLVSVYYDGRATIQVFPNPSTDKIFVTGLPIGTTVKVFSYNGVLVQTSITTNTTHIIQVSNLASGIYFIKATSKNGTENTLKFMKN